MLSIGFRQKRCVAIRGDTFCEKWRTRQESNLRPLESELEDYGCNALFWLSRITDCARAVLSPYAFRTANLAQCHRARRGAKIFIFRPPFGSVVILPGTDSRPFNNGASVAFASPFGNRSQGCDPTSEILLRHFGISQLLLPMRDIVVSELVDGGYFFEKGT